MPYKTIAINLTPITVMGVDYDSLDNFEVTLKAMGTVMFEDFDPTPKA